jgi:hypothetical protein
MFTRAAAFSAVLLMLGIPAAGEVMPVHFSTTAYARTACTPGGIGHLTYWRQPGSETVWWTSKAKPNDGCAYIYPEAQSTDGHNTYGGHIHYDNGVQSTATVYDNGYLGKSWVIEWTGASCFKKRYYPTTTRWQKKANSYCSSH